LLYTFDEGAGTLVLDRADAGPPLQLTIATPDAATWTLGALSVPTANLLVSDAAATRVATACAAANAFTVEVWVKPAQVGGAFDRIFAASPSANDRNFTLSQNVGEYAIAIRTTTANPSTITTTDAAVATALTHVVARRDTAGAVTIVIDGVVRGTGTAGGDLSTWDPTFPIDMADAPTLNRPWIGELRLAALYCRALSDAEIATNRAAGPDP
jgi:hypothetical protein